MIVGDGGQRSGISHAVALFHVQAVADSFGQQARLEVAFQIGSGTLVVEHFAQSWSREIQEGVQLQRHLPLTRVNQTQRTQRGFEIFQHYA
jgi:hypothetical protein